jgi:predicted aldo/keto reductase-like oxidoreductase
MKPRQIESLKRLQTDRLDMLKIHDVKAEDLGLIRSRGNLTDIVVRLKKEGVTRFIGFSGHSEASAMKSMAESGMFDSMLIALNHWAGNTEKRQENAIPAAKAQGMGIMVMKVVRPRETVKALMPSDLVRFALSLKGPDGIVVGIDSMEVLKSNLEILRNFTPMNESEMNTFALQMQPFYHSAALPWKQTGYHDGRWV